MLSLAEMLPLQGMPTHQFKLRGLSIRPTMFARMIGNAFTQTMVVRILAVALPYAKLTRPLCDPVGIA